MYEPAAGLLGRVADADAIVRDVERERPLGSACRDVIERSALPARHLTLILGQLDREPAPHQAAERSACLELG